MANNQKFNYAFDTEVEAILALQAEGRRLKYIALKVWRQYLASYKPKEYAFHLTGITGKRTRNTQRGIKLGRVKKLDDSTFGIELTFEDDLMYHESAFGSKYQKGHSIMLISEGWQVKRGWHKDIENFGYFEGINYIEKVKEAFIKDAKKGITLEVQWAGSEFKKRRKQPNVLK